MNAKITIEPLDRVAVIKDGCVKKGRVVWTLDSLIAVSFEKGGALMTYNRSEVMLLYRYVDTPDGPGVIPFVIAAPTAKL